jgi:hypothetical protein
MPSGGHIAFRYRIVFASGKREGSAIHTFYAPDQPTADRYAKQWAARRRATSLTRLKGR